MGDADRIDFAIGARRDAKTCEEWEAAGVAIKATADAIPLARTIGDVVLPTSGGMTARAMLGASGVLAIARALMA